MTQNEYSPKVYPHPERPAYLQLSDYVFLDIPYTALNIWRFESSTPFIFWKARFSIPRLMIALRRINILKSDKFLQLQKDMIELFVKYELHSPDDNKWDGSPQVLRADCKFAQYKAGINEIYFEDWKHSPVFTLSGPNYDNKVPENIYPIHIDRKIAGSHIEIQISLFTDFWFPWTTGEKITKSAQSRSDMYDNRQLAWGHTPRLNRCLFEVKQLIIAMGGEWTFDKTNAHELYKPMILDTGIVLDIPDNPNILQNKPPH